LTATAPADATGVEATGAAVVVVDGAGALVGAVVVGGAGVLVVVVVVLPGAGRRVRVMILRDSRAVDLADFLLFLAADVLVVFFDDFLATFLAVFLTVAAWVDFVAAVAVPALSAKSAKTIRRSEK
jgi:hypothetical protein